jgi:hypothetical protein
MEKGTKLIKNAKKMSNLNSMSTNNYNKKQTDD